MRKLLFILVLICTSANAQLWTENNLALNPITELVVKEYQYKYITDSVISTIKISPIFNNSVLIQTNISIGRFKFTKKGFTAKVIIKYYDSEGYLVDRSIDRINLGINPSRNFGIIDNKKLQNYLFNKNGYVVIWYKGLINNYEIPIVVSCLSYKSS